MKVSFRVPVLGLLAVLLAACGSSGAAPAASSAPASSAAAPAPSSAAKSSAAAPPSSAAPASAGAAAPASMDKVNIRVDWLLSDYHSPFILGIQKGWYKDSGIDLTVDEGKGSGEVAQLVGAGKETFGFAAAESVVRSVDKGVPLVSVANLMPNDPSAIFALKKSGISDPKQLKGKKIATTVGGTSDVLLPAFLKGAGVDPSEVTVVPVDPASKVQIMLQGKVDAMNAPGWSYSYFDSAGGANGWLYSDYGVKLVGYGIITSADTASKNPDLVKRFVAATLKSWAYAKDHQEESLQALEKVSPENAKPDVMKRNREDFPEAMKLVGSAVQGKPLGYQSDADWTAMQKLMTDYQLLKAPIPNDKVVTNQFVPAS